MSKRAPNNRPWIVLGVLCGFAVLALFGFGVYTGASAVSSEVSVSFPEQSQQESAKYKLAISVSAENDITFQGKSFETVEALKEELLKIKKETLESTAFVVTLSEKSSHAILISLKDMLDDLALKSYLLIDRQNAE